MNYIEEILKIYIFQVVSEVLDKANSGDYESLKDLETELIDTFYTFSQQLDPHTKEIFKRVFNDEMNKYINEIKNRNEYKDVDMIMEEIGWQ